MVDSGHKGSPQPSRTGSFPSRCVKALGETVKPALLSIRFLLSLMIPVSLGVLFLEESGLLRWVARIMAPLMGLLGLPGEAALVVVSSVLLNIYSAIAVIEALPLSGRDIVILATLCCIAHNFFIECTMLKKTGSLLPRMVLLRLVSSIVAAWVLNRLLPAAPPMAEAVASIQSHAGAVGIEVRKLPTLLLGWLTGSGFLILRISLIVFAVIFGQKLLDEFGLIKKLGRIMAPLMRIFGLSANSGYVWIVAYVAGLAYGSAILIEETRSGLLSPSEADLFNHHAAISHSQIEDNLLFAALGVPFLWIALPRFIAALITVWLERGRRILFRRSFRVKIMG